MASSDCPPLGSPCHLTLVPSHCPASLHVPIASLLSPRCSNRADFLLKVQGELKSGCRQHAPGWAVTVELSLFAGSWALAAARRLPARVSLLNRFVLRPSFPPVPMVPLLPLLGPFLSQGMWKPPIPVSLSMENNTPFHLYSSLGLRPQFCFFKDNQVILNSRVTSLLSPSLAT